MEWSRCELSLSNKESAQYYMESSTDTGAHTQKKHTWIQVVYCSELPSTTNLKRPGKLVAPARDPKQQAEPAAQTTKKKTKTKIKIEIDAEPILISDDDNHAAGGANVKDVCMRCETPPPDGVCWMCGSIYK